MPVSPIAPPLPDDVALVLLVLLPTVPANLAAQTWTATTATLNLLQTQLATANHPAVVRSFDGKGLPAFVLQEHGIEVWRQQDLPKSESIVAELLSKALPTPVQAPVTQD